MSIDIESGPARGTPFVNTSGGKEISVTDEAEAAAVVEEVLDHRRRGLGKLVGLAGMPRHGKTEFAKQVRDNRKFGRDDIRDYAAGGKTYGGKVNLYFLPGHPRRDVLIDLAGEDFQEFGRYGPSIPEVMQRVLWPVLPRLDGLILFVALPYLWAAWNQVDGSGATREPGEVDLRAIERETLETINSATVLLKYALVAKQLNRVRRMHPNLRLTKPNEREGLWAPDRHTIDEAFKAVDALDIPVFIALSKADLCHTSAHPRGLCTPPLPANAKAQYHARIQPELSDPMILAMQAFPRLHEFLSKHVRYFKYDFVQAIRDTSMQPDPAIIVGQKGIPELRGVESALEFVADHPWGIGSPGTASAVKWSRAADPDRWERDGMQKALGETWPATMPTFAYTPAPPPDPWPTDAPMEAPIARMETPAEAPVAPSPFSVVPFRSPAPPPDTPPERAWAAPSLEPSDNGREEPVSGADGGTRSDVAKKDDDPDPDDMFERNQSKL